MPRILSDAVAALTNASSCSNLTAGGGACAPRGGDDSSGYDDDLIYLGPLALWSTVLICAGLCLAVRCYKGPDGIIYQSDEPALL